MRDPIVECYIRVINEDDNESTMSVDKWDNERWLNKKGELHRIDGPAIISPDGSEAYYKNGILHRKNGPAVIHSNGSIEYWVNGERHREDGPAVVYDDGSQVYYINNKRHREDGPAIIYPEGVKDYYINNVQIFKGNGTEPSTKIEGMERTVYVDPYGQLHRLNGPAVIYKDGEKEYWVNNKYYSPDEYFDLIVKRAIDVGNDESDS